jgi:hypothetical protein
MLGVIDVSDMRLLLETELRHLQPGVIPGHHAIALDGSNESLVKAAAPRSGVEAKRRALTTTRRAREFDS